PDGTARRAVDAWDRHAHGTDRSVLPEPSDRLQDERADVAPPQARQPERRALPDRAVACKERGAQRRPSEDGGKNAHRGRRGARNPYVQLDRGTVISGACAASPIRV